jgi:branched-subunit amino acid transport protein
MNERIKEFINRATVVSYNMKLGRLQLYHYAKQTLIYLPAPVFFALGVYNLLFSHSAICGGLSWEMPLMWFLMAATHSYPWVVYFEVRNCRG